VKPTVIQPGTLDVAAGDPPFLRLPERSLFRTRAARLSALASGHALGDYLRFLGALANAQDAALALVRDVPLPGGEELARCREHGLPPLGIQGWKRAPVWREALHRILVSVESGALPEATRAAIDRLRQLDDSDLERAADRLLGGDLAPLDRAQAPFIAAALQTYWLHMVTSLGVESFARLDATYLCPACGSEPVASVVRIGGADHGLRYLNCSLCNAQWHVVRIKCVFCGATKGISYYGIEGGSAAVKAERCDTCESYLKILYMEKEPNVDAIADDVSSLGLDILMAESGVARSGLNFFLLGGDA
jgi:FdhE protein